MASVAIMAQGALLNAVAFIGSNYLALQRRSQCSFTRKSEARQGPRGVPGRLTPTIKNYEPSCLSGLHQQPHKTTGQANLHKRRLRFQAYNQAHQQPQLTVPREPKFSDFCRPSDMQKQSEPNGVINGVRAFNSVPSNIRSATEFNTFKSLAKNGTSSSSVFY